MAVAELSAEPLLTSVETSQAVIIWRRFRKHKLAVTGIAVLLFLFLFSFVGPVFRPYHLDDIVAAANLEPNSTFPFGTDEIGRDVLTRLMYAGRISLLLSIIVTVFGTLIGVVVGAAAGYFGGWIDTIAMRAVDFILTLPLLPLILILSAMQQRGGLPLTTPEFVNQLFGMVWAMPADNAENILILAGILIFFTSWLQVSRLVRGQILSLRGMDYTDAARALGVSPWRIIFRHMIPNSLAPIIVAATFSFGEIIVLEAALSFLGFGVQNPSPSWGNMLNNVREFMLIQPWRAFVPGVTIFLASLSFNFVGDALRDALDPRLKM